MVVEKETFSEHLFHKLSVQIIGEKRVTNTGKTYLELLCCEEKEEGEFIILKIYYSRLDLVENQWYMTRGETFNIDGKIVKKNLYIEIDENSQPEVPTTMHGGAKIRKLKINSLDQIKPFEPVNLLLLILDISLSTREYSKDHKWITPMVVQVMDLNGQVSSFFVSEFLASLLKNKQKILIFNAHISKFGSLSLLSLKYESFLCIDENKLEDYKFPTHRSDFLMGRISLNLPLIDLLVNSCKPETSQIHYEYDENRKLLVLNDCQIRIQKDEPVIAAVCHRCLQIQIKDRCPMCQYPSSFAHFILRVNILSNHSMIRARIINPTLIKEILNIQENESAQSIFEEFNTNQNDSRMRTLMTKVDLIGPIDCKKIFLYVSLYNHLYTKIEIINFI